MELIPSTLTDPRYQQAEELLLQSFPPEERRSLDQIRTLMLHEPDFCPHLIIENDQFAGLLNYWKLDGFIYAEHLATSPALRGGGIGGKALDLLSTLTSLPIVLEVEHPDTELAQRRIGFYRRHGYVLWNKKNYIQPPYDKDLPWLPLLLMVHGPLQEEKDFELVRKEIYEKVYHRQVKDIPNTVK